MDPTETARTYFHAIQTGDLETVGTSLADNVVWHQPGSNRFSGDHTGRDAVFAMIGQMMQVSEGSFAIDEVRSLMATGDLVAATIHFVGRREGAEMSMDGLDLLRITDGKISEVWLFSADQPAEDTFWGSDGDRSRTPMTTPRAPGETAWRRTASRS